MATEAEKIETIHKAFINFAQRAEKVTDEVLVDTFVDSAPLLDLLSNKNNMILYGRRGTGKTHALKFLENQAKQRGEIPIYIDLRSVGSNTSIYGDSTKSLSERATQLINDILQSILSSLYPIAVEHIDIAIHKEQLTIRLDDFQSAISSVKVHGIVENQREESSKDSESLKGSAELALVSKLSGKLSVNKEASATTTTLNKSTNSGTEIIHVDFGSVKASLAGFIEILGISKLWLLVDEWSEVPIELQPYLADLIRRIILPINTCTVKIAAIEHRSNFILSGKKGEYIGLELGADISASLNLDDFLVFDADEKRSIQFFKNLIFKHYSNSEHADESILTAEGLVQTAFTQNNVFSEFVRAVEGVPRDAINLAATVATKAYGNKISMQHVRSAARDWYQRDKASILRGNEVLANILQIILAEVIGKRKARAFLFRNNIRDQNIEALFDARLLHVLKKNISSKDEPGIRYDAFKMDFGCYVDLINTNNEPRGLYEVDGEYTDVPKDDYRSIRRAILKPELLIDAATSA